MRRNRERILDGWNILLGAILAAYALPYILAAIFAVTCIGFAIKAANRQNFVLSILLFVVAFTPALIPPAIELGKRTRAETRTEQIAGLKRARIDGTPPRALVARGGIGWPHAFRLMALGAFTEVHQIGRRGDHIVLRLNSTTQCNALAAATRNAFDRGALKEAELTRDMEDCLRETSGSGAEEGLPDHAIILLVDHESALKPSNSLKSNSVFELRLKTPSQDALLDYWEAPDAAAEPPPLFNRKPYVPRPELDIVAFILDATRPPRQS
ncbi:hypothetical protein GVN21_05095 [Caulobacter sp. SLTY]|uniref:hypothetical protein n=1 Tax=Caulobacter sp. SLTY TaxID=2683262 RepID=UPI00141363BA|nr:hypothetical protein [Caulobacter sp. SLTY]NBB14738.1 hypothetical protein [Caulobacter sp. SLTY]